MVAKAPGFSRYPPTSRLKDGEDRRIGKIRSPLHDDDAEGLFVSPSSSTRHTH